jgi:uncharacterized repeat protein (TIGR01451 family)/fimbrial isopeptide formation D2 family protein
MSAAIALLGLSAVANAQAVDCSSFPNATIDGDLVASPTNINVDTDCTIRDFPQGNELIANISFYTAPGQTNVRHLLVFDNVYHTGQMSCATVLNHKVWFVNGASTEVQEKCQNLLIPVEKIDKRNPPNTTTAAVGVPFTYTMLIPVLYDPAADASGNAIGVIDFTGSPNDLHSIRVTDDLNATGVDLNFVSYNMYWRDTGAPVSHTFSNTGGLLDFVVDPVIPATEQIVIEITVVLADTPVNAPGTQFVNTAKWSFGRLIEGVFYEPLPGEWGISEPLTIAAPDLVMTKTGPANLNRTLNLGEWGQFGLDVQNTGTSDAFDLTIVDQLPDGPSGGMCDVTPQILSAQVFAADGVTPVPGKGPLAEGVDYVQSYAAAPSCELTLQMQSPQAVVAPGERLVINYQTQLDSDSQNGALLSNIAGVTRWYNGDSTNVDRITYIRSLTSGTPGTLDHEDIHTVEVGLYGWFFEKTVENLSSGENPATVAAPGDTLRYSIRLQTTDGPLASFRFYDDLGSMNAAAVFRPGSLRLRPQTIPPGADTSNTEPNGGTNLGGIVDIRNLDLPAYSEVTIEFDVTLEAAILDGTIVTNQADLLSDAGTPLAVSDDPNVNGQADPNVAGDEDPTRVLVEVIPPETLTKANTQATATIGETFSYEVTVPSVPHSAPLYDVRIVDDLSLAAADLEFVSVSRVSGSGAWTPQNTGTATNLVVEDPVNGIDIPAGEQFVIEITVRLADTPTNVAGLTFTNTADYTYNLIDADPVTQRPGFPGTTEPMTVVEPDLTLEKTGPLRTRLGIPETFTVNVHNAGTSPAYAVTLTDVLPNQADGGMCDAAPQNITAQVFATDGTTPVSPVLAEGTDYIATFAGAPTCVLTLQMLTGDATIGVDQRLIVTYEAQTDAGTQENAALTNVAGATEWFSIDPSDPAGRNYVRTVTDGTVGTLDHEDAHTTTVFTPVLIFEKYAVNVTTGEDPATVATPGDTIRYTLRMENANDTIIDNLSITDELDRLNAVSAFAPGTLSVVSIPAGADDSNTDANGGAAGTGLLDVTGLALSGLGDSFEIVFEVQLAPVIANDTIVLNQSVASYTGNPIALSDDPNVDGAADPNVDGDEDPTEIRIQSAPYFDVDKVSSYIDGDPNVLFAGERLRYTITVDNTGTDNATNVYIRDMVPANTTYVADSTTLNGSPVADGANGSPLIDGILLGDIAVNDPVVSVVFDVVVYPDVPDGTIISNQAFVNAEDQGLADVPSDDPRTDLPDDPTRDVVGNFPLLYAIKTAALQIDNGSSGIVDPGDTLRYTITVYNNGNVPATVVELLDDVPANTTYVADSTMLDGAAVGQPDNGAFPLASRILVGANGVLDPGASTTVQFDLLVDAGVPRGTLITNQATVYSAEVANLLTDADGDPSNGMQPTVVVVGDAQVLSIVKDVAVVGGGAAIPGATLEYTVTVQNVGNVPAQYVLLRDDLDEVNPGYITYVDQSATLNGLTTGVSVAGQVITADYFDNYGPLMPGEFVTLRFQADIDVNLVEGTTIVNTGRVYWDDPQQQAEASVSIDVGAMPDAGMLSGEVWHDADHDNAPGTVERSLEGWTVELILDNQVVRSMQTDADGYYVFTNVPPNYIAGETYSIRFAAPGATMTTALMGEADSDFTDGQQRIDDIDVQEGSNLLALNMPADPNGVVYDSISRGPVPGAIVTLLDARNSQPLPTGCFDDPNQQGQVTIGNGYYKFDINFSDPACPGPGNYLLQVTAPSVAYVPGVSAMIPPTSDLTTLPFDVPSCAGSTEDVVAATTQHCEAQTSEFAPDVSVVARSVGTSYHLFLRLDGTSIPGSSQLFNNHIPLDPRLDGAVAVTKTTPMLHVTRGQLVPYVITVSNSFGAALRDVDIVDRFPAGFRYVEGSARFDDVPAEPVVNGRELTWSGLVLQTDGRHEIKLLLAVGAGVTEGEFINRAQATNALTGQVMSAEAQAKVRIIPDPTFDCTDVMGTVYDDSNRNGLQDGDEGGLPGVRVVTARGLAATTDQYGRYNITCAIVPHESRGSNFVLKLDDRTLPSGFRASTRPVQVQRATRGKALRINFGASIHRVVGLDIADPVFYPDSSELRDQWEPRVSVLLDELRKGPAVLRLSYVADLEPESLVNERLDDLKDRIMKAWLAEGGGYELVIEPEVFWRLGGPARQPRGGEQ